MELEGLYKAKKDLFMNDGEQFATKDSVYNMKYDEDRERVWCVDDKEDLHFFDSAFLRTHFERTDAIRIEDL